MNKSPRNWRTNLIHPDIKVPGGFRSLTSPLHRASTTVFERLADVADDWHPERYSYGLYGTPTTLELGLRIAQLEKAKHAFVVPGGQAALTLVYLAYCRAGTHVLLPENVYGPSMEFATQLLSGLGIEVEVYDPMIGERIASLLRPNTALIWTETPGSVTMEIPDVPAIVAAAHARGVPVALDNTYAAGVLFDAFGAGVDISVQALTKYIGGHSDLLLGTVSVASEHSFERIGNVSRLLGMAVSPDDCALALRGLQTLAVRLDHLERTATAVAAWLAERDEVAHVLHPAFADCPGHDIWKRDFTGSASLFSVVFERRWDVARITRFVEALRLFKLGYSWGGVASLVMAYPTLQRRYRDYGQRVVRFNVGLEDASDLIADIEQALESSR
jgi:cysteine-S-conjugate beta-lyase